MRPVEKFHGLMDRMSDIAEKDGQMGVAAMHAYSNAFMSMLSPADAKTIREVADEFLIEAQKMLRRSA